MAVVVSVMMVTMVVVMVADVTTLAGVFGQNVGMLKAIEELALAQQIDGRWVFDDVDEFRTAHQLDELRLRDGLSQAGVCHHV